MGVTQVCFKSEAVRCHTYREIRLFLDSNIRLYGDSLTRQGFTILIQILGRVPATHYTLYR